MSTLSENNPEFALLGPERMGTKDDEARANDSFKYAPIFTNDVLGVLGEEIFPQRAVYGRILEASSGVKVSSPIAAVYINSNTPFSGILCGVQGSGKSHSTSVLLESCLILDKRLGTLPEPLCGLMFHYDSVADAGGVPPCEAAYIASLDPRLGEQATPPNVVVLVMPPYLNKMRKAYEVFPNVTVEPLHFAEEDMNGERILAMMKVDQDHQMPLYMERMMSILRSVETITYTEFLQRIRAESFSPTQKAMLDLRLALLDSFLKDGTTSNRVSTHFRKGQLTIIDLSSPFMDASSACGFFDIILGLFIEAKKEGGKLVVLDEAHKYLTSSGSSSRLTESLLSIIRQQRHLATRVLISTQEPTVVPSKFLDLCSFVIAHRFSSPKWIDHLKDHISTIDDKWCSKVISLRTGEAMMFSPAGLFLRQSEGEGHSEDKEPSVDLLGRGYLCVRSRERITRDGGRSILAADRSKDRENETNIHSTLDSQSQGAEELAGIMRARSTGTTDRPKDGEHEADTLSTLDSQGVEEFAGMVRARAILAAESLKDWENETNIHSTLDSQGAGEFDHVVRPRSILEADRSKDEEIEANIYNILSGEGAEDFSSMMRALEQAKISHQIESSPSSDSISLPTSSRKLFSPSQFSKAFPLPGSGSSSLLSPAFRVSSPLPQAPPPTRINLQGKIPKEFLPLVTLLQRHNQKMAFTDVGIELKKINPVPYFGKLGKYLKRAEEAGLVVISTEGYREIVKLSAKSTGHPGTCPPEYTSLVRIIRELSSNGQAVRRSDVGSRLRQSGSKAIETTFKEFIRGAEATGVVVCPSNDTLALAPSFR